MVIAIDGPAGSGKSTIARMLAKRLNFTYINSGNLYRAITLCCLRKGINPVDPEEALTCAKEAVIDYRGQQVLLDGEVVDELLHSDVIDAWVAQLSAIVPIRHVVNDLIRKIAEGKNVVIEGRDITTVVFPDAKYRFYLDASPESRAQRRFMQGVSQLSLEEIADNIRKRDEIDRNKEEGSLKIADGVVYLDTSDLTIEQVYDRLIEKIQL